MKIFYSDFVILTNIIQLGNKIFYNINELKSFLLKEKEKKIENLLQFFLFSHYDIFIRYIFHPLYKIMKVQ